MPIKVKETEAYRGQHNLPSYTVEIAELKYKPREIYLVMYREGA